MTVRGRAAGKSGQYTVSPASATWRRARNSESGWTDPSPRTAMSMEQHIAEIVAAAPPLTPEQRDRIALLLKSGA
jgi:hypothetical protein